MSQDTDVNANSLYVFVSIIRVGHIIPSVGVSASVICMTVSHGMLSSSHLLLHADNRGRLKHVGLI